MAEVLAPWTDGYLRAAVALEVLGARAWLDAATLGESIIGAPRESFSLAEGASRSDQRSQGYRMLVKALAETPGRVLARSPKWQSRGSKRGRRRAMSSYASHSPRFSAKRDPAGTLRANSRGSKGDSTPRRLLAAIKTYVGPTRKRGARAALSARCKRY